MRWMIACTVLALLADDKTDLKFTFARGDLGKLPAGWKSDQTNKGKASVWKVVADASAPSGSGHALAQTAEGPNAVFNLCVAEKTRFTDVDISVKFKSVAGKLDQGGGVVWRYQDADNYYVARYNPLEENFRVYKVVKGKRIQLGNAEQIGTEEGTKWVTLSVTMKGDRITCSLAGKKHLEAKDGTFPKAGKVGLWTKADAQTRFDELTVKGK